MVQGSGKWGREARLEAAGWITSSLGKPRRTSQGMEPPVVGQVLSPPIMAIKIILFHRLIVQVLLDFNQVGSYFIYSPIGGGGGRERSSYCKSDLTLDLQLSGFLRAWCVVFQSLASCSILSGGGRWAFLVCGALCPCRGALGTDLPCSLCCPLFFLILSCLSCWRMMSFSLSHRVRVLEASIQ